LTLSLDNQLADHSAEIRQRVARQFDVDADVHANQQQAIQKPLPTKAITSHPGTRAPGAWDGFETVLREFLGQQVTVKASLTIASRVVSRHSEKLKNPRGSLTALSPFAEDLDNANLDSLGLTGARIKTIHAVANALAHQGLDLHAGEPHAYIRTLTALPGIGDWTAQYVAMVGLQAKDAFPTEDIILSRAATTLGHTLSEKRLR
jgi:AraC family transcriptional regulator of adaptative response / DNA-3-methyladenine glycosylase II